MIMFLILGIIIIESRNTMIISMENNIYIYIIRLKILMI